VAQETVAQVFVLPDLGEGLTEASLVRWLVGVGDEIAVDQPIAEVETAKSVVEVPSPFAGVVQTLHGAEGDALAVGEPLVTIAGHAAPVPGPVEGHAEAAGSGNVLVGYGTSEVSHTGRRRRRRVAPTATAGRVARNERIETPSPGLDTLAGAHYSTTETAGRSADRIAVSSPVVRQLAKSHGLDLAGLQASGSDGVITRRDVEAALAEQSRDVDERDVDERDVDGCGVDQRTGLEVRTTTPFSLFRKTVAANMSRSRTEIPEATVWVDVDVTDLHELRRRIRLGDKHPSLLALIGRFTVAALAKYPMLAGRISADGGSLIEFDGVNLGFAADTPRGLVVPVVKRADALSLRELDAELARLTQAARSGATTPAELSGSTFTINNYGSLGVDGSAAIINHPEVGILGIGRILERPWVVDGQIVPRRIVQFSLVFDHRVCDGGVAAGFLRAIADAAEHPYDAFADL
jgi:pyruvate dehydrogenase E2 component (dihydrolipoamide acetyltransferase)